FIELGPELNHLDIDEIETLCRSPEINIQRINIQLTENKIIVKESFYVFQLLKKNITATEMGFFTTTGGKTLESTKITLAVRGMESIEFGEKGLSVLPSITNKKIDVRYMAVMDIAGVFEKEEKEKTKKKEFVIRERLYVKNTGIFFLECLGNTAFIPVVEIEINHFLKKWGRFEEAVGIHVKTNALVGNISTEIKQMIGEIIAQKETVMKKELGYPKLVFEEDFGHGEQSESEESSEKPITKHPKLEEFKEDSKHEEQSEQPINEYKDQEVCLKEGPKRHLCC
ncbi:MAG: uncharacterized protein A8A55_3387, partial [Amphiamblys sp. WSBS2006]